MWLFPSKNCSAPFSDYMMDSMWQTPVFREAISQRLVEAIRIYGNATCMESSKMESHVFQKSNSREEYLETSARIIVYLRKMNVRKNGLPEAPPDDHLEQGPSSTSKDDEDESKIKKSEEEESGSKSMGDNSNSCSSKKSKRRKRSKKMGRTLTKQNKIQEN